MSYRIDEKKIELFLTLFKGRNDIYAKRWEKGSRTGYMPAYQVDWSDYNKHKASGGTFGNYDKKEFLPFSNDAVIEHLTGRLAVGIYPLLEDNTSYFIAADFDKSNWAEECRNLYKVCIDNEIPAYIERSRSGSGGHIWIFFENRYPAKNSRQIMFELLRIANIISTFEKEPSFDRLFPNQDYHSGKGIGNLIALPLNGKSLQDNNTCFLNPENFEPYEDQWKFLKSIKKISTDKLNEIFGKFFGDIPVLELLSNIEDKKTPELEITIQNQVYLKRNQLNRKLTIFLRDNLNFLNSDYLVKKNLGKSVYKTEKYFKLIEEERSQILIPRGFVSTLVNFCRKENIPFNIKDNRKKLQEINIKADIDLFLHQELAIESTDKKDFGVIVAPPGSGKTIIGLEIIKRKKQPALIIVHRKQLFDQWIERIQSFLKLPKNKIGRIGNNQFKLGNEITIAMIQSLSKTDNVDEIANSFGTIIIDECHHIPAKTFRETIVHFNAWYLYGLTATPKRKNNDEKLIFIYIGDIIAKIDQEQLTDKGSKKIEVNIKETNLYVPFDYKVDHYETISQILVHDTQRNQMIIEDIESQIERCNSILVLTERKAHVNILNLYLKDRFETITITGDDSESARQSKIEQIKAGHYKIVLSTGQFFGEGIDVSNLECLFLVYPFAFEGKLIQYIGRIQHSEKPPIIFDYRDKKIDYFEKLFKQRNRYYKKLHKSQEG